MYDCIIVGGGPAGLTAAIFLGRYRRRVLLIDAGQGRNKASHGIHGFLGYDGIAPAELISRAREEAISFGVELISDQATKVEKCGDYFEVTSGNGIARGRRVLLAYGVRDTYPQLERFDEFFGTSIFHCPDCDGYEVRDRRIGVIGNGKKVAGLALELLLWSDRIAVFTDGEATEMDAEQSSKLEARGIEVVREEIRELVGRDGRLSEVRLSSGRTVPCEAIFFTLGVERTCSLAEGAGCEISDEGISISTDEHGETTIEGIYAAGDLVAGSQLVIKSAADGAVAAIAINKSLLPDALRV